MRRYHLATPAEHPPSATAVLLTSSDRRADWLHARHALYRLLLHAASQWVFASLHTQPLEDVTTCKLISSQLALSGYPRRCSGSAGHPSPPPPPGRRLVNRTAPDDAISPPASANAADIGKADGASPAKARLPCVLFARSRWCVSISHE